MADDFNKLAVLIEANTRSYENAMRRIEAKTNAAFGNVERQAKRLDTSFSQAAAGVGRIGAALAAGLSISAAVKFADAFTRIENSLKTAGLASSELANVQERLFQIAQENAVSWEALAGLYSKVSLVQKELGVSSEDLLNFTDNVSKALRVSGTSAEQASGALLQLSQALGSGTVRAEEFNSILEGAPAIARAAAAGLAEANGSVAQLKQLVIDGKVSSDVFFRAFQEGSKGLDAQLKNTEVTVSGAFQKLSNALTKSVGDFDNATGASNVFAESLNGIAKAIDSIDWQGLISGYQDYARESRKYGLQIRNMVKETFGYEGDYSFLPQVSGGEKESPGKPRNVGVPRNFTFGVSNVKPISMSSGSSTSAANFDQVAKAATRATAETRQFENVIERVEEKTNATADALSGFASSFAGDMMRGVSATEALASSLGSLADRLMSAGLDALISGLAGGFGGGGGYFGKGGFTNFLPFGGPRAMGGPVSPGKAYLVGERGPELFVPSAVGKVASNQNSMAGGGMTVHIDARGAQAGVGEEIRRALSEYSRGEYGRTVAHMQQARKRRAI
jgi:tape measure domain-containing protein